MIGRFATPSRFNGHLRIHPESLVMRHSQYKNIARGVKPDKIGDLAYFDHLVLDRLGTLTSGGARNLRRIHRTEVEHHSCAPILMRFNRKTDFM